MKSRFVVTIMICIVTMLSITACWNRHELDELAILMGMGIDKAEQPGKVLLTAQIVNVGELKAPKKEAGSASNKAFWNIQSKGDTVFEAVRGFSHESSRKLFVQHNQVLIFGREIAEEGVQKYIDLFVRDHESRLNVSILVAKKGSASEIFDVKSELEKLPTKNIADLLKNQSATSQSSVVNLKQFLTRLMSKTTAPVAPLIEVIGEGKEQAVLVSGTAVFKKDKLVGQLNKSETRGLLWGIDEVKSGIVVVDCPGGDGKASLEIIRSSGKITPEIKDHTIRMTVEIKVEGNLSEQSGSENLTLRPAIDVLQKEEAQIIRGEVMAAFKKAREYKSDIFGFGELIHQKHPKQWKDLEKTWDEHLQEVEVEVLVKAKLHQSGKINKPAISEQE